MDSSTVDRDFLEARAGLVSLAAYLDRVDRCGGNDDFRHRALLDCLPLLTDATVSGKRARSVLTALSDPSHEPSLTASTQGASGAPQPKVAPQNIG